MRNCAQRWLWNGCCVMCALMVFGVTALQLTQRNTCLHRVEDGGADLGPNVVDKVLCEAPEHKQA